MSNRVFLHGVPNTPQVWGPLLAQLTSTALTPCLPGFCYPTSPKFRGSKDDYATWLVGLLEDRHARYGPIDIVGHDWGAILALRAASLRPDLIKSWAICGAAVDPNYRGHLLAHVWNTPWLGEAAMAMTHRKLLELVFRRGSLPPDLARSEASAWSPGMRGSILALYRSANGLRFEGDWIDRLDALPSGGLLIWGENDPYVPVCVAHRFARRHRAALQVEPDAGHWVIVERAAQIAATLIAHWDGTLTLGGLRIPAGEGYASFKAP